MKKEIFRPLVKKFLPPSMAALGIAGTLTAVELGSNDQVWAENNSPKPTPLPPGPRLVLNEPMPSQRSIEASTTLTDTLANTLVSAEWLSQNPQDIGGIAYVKDQISNNVTGWFIVNKRNNVLYESHIDNSQFTENRPLGSIPIENPSNIAVSPDGDTIFVVGRFRDQNADWQFQLAASFDRGRTFRQVNTNIQEAGYSLDSEHVYFIPGSNNQFLIETGSDSTHVGLHVATPDSQTQTVVVTPTEALGHFRLLTMTSVDNASGVINYVADYVAYDRGIAIGTLNYKTGEFTSRNINTITLPDNSTTGLGSVDTLTTYTDTQGHLHAVVVNNVTGMIYNVDTFSSTASGYYVTDWLDRKGVSTFNGMAVTSIKTRVDVQNNLYVMLGVVYQTHYSSGPKYPLVSGVAEFKWGTDPSANPDLLKYAQVTSSDLGTSIVRQEGVQIENVENRSVLLLNTKKGGQALQALNSDGSFNPDNPVYFISKGLQNEIPVSTATATATSTWTSTATPDFTPTWTATSSPTPQLSTLTPSPSPSPTPTPTIQSICQAGWKYLKEFGKCFMQTYLPFITVRS